MSERKDGLEEARIEAGAGVERATRRVGSDGIRTVVGTRAGGFGGDGGQATSGQKNFVRKETTPPPPDDPGNPTVNFHGEKRSNATHASITDSDALLYKKAEGHEAKRCYLGHVLIEMPSSIRQALWLRSSRPGSVP